MVRIHNLRAASCGFESQKKSMVMAGRASDRNSLLSSSKVSLLPREQTPRLCTGNIGSINGRKKIVSFSGVFSATSSVLKC